MKLFVWEVVEHLTGCYHHEGGVVVVAETLEDARSRLPEECGAREFEPTATFELTGSPKPEVFIFPNAGCC